MTLFSPLSFFFQAAIPHLVVGNQITASLFSDIQLIISLSHTTGTSTTSSSGGKSQNSSSMNGNGVSTMSNDKKGGNSGQQQQQSQRDHSHVHSHVLEHSLHQLLRLQHSRNINPDGACLSSAPVGKSQRDCGLFSDFILISRHFLID